MEQQRLDRTAWIEAGLKALAGEGDRALRADRLARALGVSRGSFYWHFTDVMNFHEAVLDAWERAMVDEPLEWSLRSTASTAAALNRLIAGAFLTPPALERAVHRWGVTSPLAAARIASVNARRIAKLAELFVASGISADHAARSARLLYWAYLGRVLTDGDTVNPPMLEEIRQRLGVRH